MKDENLKQYKEAVRIGASFGAVFFGGLFLMLFLMNPEPLALLFLPVIALLFWIPCHENRI